MKTLNDLSQGQTATIDSFEPAFGLSRRLMELGLLPGTEIRFLGAAPLGDPIAVAVEGRYLSLRRSDAAKIRLDRD